MPVTERLTLSIQDGQEWRDHLKFLLQTLKKQEGNIRTRWGPQFEDGNKLELMIGWESPAAKEKFEKSEDLAAVLAQFKPIFSAPPTSYILEFKPYAPKEIVDAAGVQMVTFENLSANVDESALRGSIEKYQGVEGCTGVAGGFAIADVEGKGKVFVAISGWSSLEASQQARSKLVVPDGQVNIVNVNFRFPVKGFRGL